MFRAFSANMHWPLCIKAIFSFTASGLVISEHPLYGLMVATNPLVCLEKTKIKRELEHYGHACGKIPMYFCSFSHSTVFSVVLCQCRHCALKLEL